VVLGVLAGGLLIIGACTGGTRSLVGPDRPPGQGDTSPTLIGEWQISYVITGEDFQQFYTDTWRFEAAGDCLFHQTIRRIVPESTITRQRDCSWSTANGRVSLTFRDTGQRLDVEYSHPGGDTSRLIFDGTTYGRIR
jgi:hypothetical protein